MRILLLGADGFIGSEIAVSLLQAGHGVRGTCRDLRRASYRLPGVEFHRIDLRTMQNAGDWLPLVADMDAVINVSGVLQSGFRDDVSAVQDRAVTALATAAKRAGVGHFVQVSAAGAERNCGNEFMASKARADAALGIAGIAHTILRPGLVIGRNCYGGTELLRMVGAFPMLRAQPTGCGRIQCVAMADLVEAVAVVLAEPPDTRAVFDLVERDGHELSEIIDGHRDWLGLPPPRWELRLPFGALRPLGWFADRLGALGWRSPLRSNALEALARGVAGDASQAAGLLGREPLAMKQAFAALGPSGKADRWHARLAAVFPFALATLVLLWLVSGVIGLARLDAARTLLEDGGIGTDLARGLVAAGSLADIAIGLAIAFRPFLRLGLKAGIALAFTYAGASLFARPDLWLDPLAPMIKILPVLALSWACLAMAEER